MNAMEITRIRNFIVAAQNRMKNSVESAQPKILNKNPPEGNVEFNRTLIINTTPVNSMSANNNIGQNIKNSETNTENQTRSNVLEKTPNSVIVSTEPTRTISKNKIIKTETKIEPIIENLIKTQKFNPKDFESTDECITYCDSIDDTLNFEVCGMDNKNYLSMCHARCNRVPVRKMIACKSKNVVGCFQNCLYSQTMDISVCGKNSKTYRSVCFLLCDDTLIKHYGMCT